MGEARRGSSAFDGNREVEERRRAARPELLFDGFVDDLLHIRSTATTAQTGTGCACHIASRTGAVVDEATNLTIGDPAAMANEHRFFSLEVSENIGSLFPKKMKINVVFIFAHSLPTSRAGRAGRLRPQIFSSHGFKKEFSDYSPPGSPQTSRGNRDPGLRSVRSRKPRQRSRTRHSRFVLPADVVLVADGLRTACATQRGHRSPACMLPTCCRSIDGILQ